MSPTQGARSDRSKLTSEMRGHFAMLSFSALVAGSFSLGSMVANEVEPAAFNAIRFLIATTLMGFIAAATGGLTRQVARAPWRFVILGGTMAFYFVTMFEGLKTAPPVSAAAVFTLTPLMAAGFGYLILRQITTVRMAGALILGGIGALWVIFKADFAALWAFNIGVGEAIFFWGCVAHAFYPSIMRRLNRGEPAFGFTFGMMFAAFWVFVVYGWNDILETDWLALPTIVWTTIVYTAVFASAGSFALLQYASLRLPSAKVMAYTYLVPSWVILWELVLGNGAPRGLVLAGVALTVVALLMLLKDEH